MSVVSPMAETTTMTGRPLEAVRATRRAAARMRSAVASDEPPYFCTSNAWPSDNDLGSLLGQRQPQGRARHLEVPRGRLKRGGDGIRLVARDTQRQKRRAGP